MKLQPTIAFIDFDKTIYDLQIPDYEDQRKLLCANLKKQFGVETKLYPILEDTEKLSANNDTIRKYIHDFIDDIEHKASGYFYDYAAKLLENLEAAMPVVVVSNNSSEVIKVRLQKAGLDKLVKYIYGRDTGAYFKPNGKVLEYCCEKISMKPSQADGFIYLGDSWRDYDCVSNFAKKNQLNYTFINPKSLTFNDFLKQ